MSEDLLETAYKGVPETATTKTKTNITGPQATSQDFRETLNAGEHLASLTSKFQAAREKISEQATKAPKVNKIPKMHDGGVVEKTGPVILEKGETVIPVQDEHHPVEVPTKDSVPVYGRMLRRDNPLVAGIVDGYVNDLMDSDEEEEVEEDEEEQSVFQSLMCLFHKMLDALSKSKE